LTFDRLRTSEIGNIRQYHIAFDAAHTVLARAFYAAQNWVDQAKYEGVASQIQHPMEQVFNPRKPYLRHGLGYTTWIQFGANVPSTVSQNGTLGNLGNCVVLCNSMWIQLVANYLIVTRGEDVNVECGFRGTPLHTALQHRPRGTLMLQVYYFFMGPT
jgi:hypothetical protein